MAVVILLSAFLLGPVVSDLSLKEYFAHPAFLKYFKNLRFAIQYELPMQFTGNHMASPVNGALWTLPIEVRCYGALMLLGCMGFLKRRWRWLITVAMLVTTLAYMALPSTNDGWINNFNWSHRRWYLLEFGMFFMAGTLISIFRIDQSRNKSPLLVACWALAAIALAFDNRLLALWLVVPATTLLFCCASLPGLRRAGRFGDLSYGVYIYAYPVQQTLMWLYRDRLSWNQVLALTVVTTLGLAFASWHFVEKRALRWKPGRPRAFEQTYPEKMTAA